MIGALPQTPEFIAFVFPKMGRKNRRQKSAAHFGVKSVQPLRSHSCVAVSFRTEKANYIINNCLEDYSIYTVCATLPKVQIPPPKDICNLFHVLYRCSKQALFGNSFVPAHTAIAQTMQFF